MTDVALSFVRGLLLADHENMVGLKKVEAGTDLVPAKTRKQKAKAKARAKEEEQEEWGGIGSQ